MSALAFYLEQITRPSWLPQEDGRRTAQPSAVEKRAAVMACLRAAGRPVGRSWIEDYTGYTKQSVNHLLTALVDEGEARRVEGGTVLMWEVA